MTGPDQSPHAVGLIEAWFKLSAAGFQLADWQLELARIAFASKLATADRPAAKEECDNG